jgi:hypothetical protein
MESRTSLLGYLTYVELPLLGTVGGLLIVDLRARPIEFHCSSPVRPSRTQEILYGPTLRSAILGDQIGKSLIAQVKQLPQLLITDDLVALELQADLSTPIAVFVGADAELSSGHLSTEIDVELGRYRVRVANDERLSSTYIRSLWETRVGDWDGLEPLERIREAIGEAHRAAA